MNIRSNIKTLVAERGITLAELAAAMGITRQTLNGLVNNPSSPTLERLAAVLSVPLWRLIATTDEVKADIAAETPTAPTILGVIWSNGTAYQVTSAEDLKRITRLLTADFG